MNFFKKSSILLSGLFVAFTLTHCSKERLAEEPVLNKYESANAFFEANKPAEQSFIVTKDGTGPIIGAWGTRIGVDSSMFRFPNDTVDVKYPFIIKLVELYIPKDMMLYNMPTVSGGKLLVTGGEIRIRAFKDNKELILKAGKSYPVGMPGNPPDNAMKIFYGVESGTIVDWTTGGGSMITDTGFYRMLLPKVGWINCDKFYSYPGAKSTIKFSSEKDDLTNVTKFLYFDGVKSLMQVYGNESGQVPVGDHVKVLCIGMKDGKMYYFKKDITVGSDNEISVTMESIDTAALLTYMGTF